MLILSRRLGESIVIGDDINVTILGVNGNQVRIGIDAPKTVAVHREEIYRKITNQIDSRRHTASTANRSKVVSRSATALR